MIRPAERFPGVPAAAPTSRDAKLRQTALQLEGLFVQQMFAAMRETVPEDGLIARSSAEETFGSLLDEKLAEQVPAQWSGPHSLAEALYRQLRQRMEAPSPDVAPLPPGELPVLPTPR